MKVVHLCPTFFGQGSFLGGAERYSLGLASAMARQTPTRLVSFDASPRKDTVNGLEIHLYRPRGYAGGLHSNPWSIAFLKSLRDADILHCHQLGTWITDLAILYGKTRRVPVFATDLGGSANFSLWYHLPLWKGLRSLLTISDFNRTRFSRLPLPAHVIYGGVDTIRFFPGRRKSGRRFLHVGRLLPHKGIHHLLEALPAGVGLDVVGPACDLAYERRLREQAQGKDIVFYTPLSDDELIFKYQEALATVLPALEDSGFTTVLESFACGTPAIVSSVGSLPELVEDGITGFVVAPENPGILRERISALAADLSIGQAMGTRARQAVLARFTWDAVVERCLQAYQRSPA